MSYEDENFVSNINYLISQVFTFSYVVVSSIGIIGNFLNLMLCLNQRIAKDSMGYFNILMSICNILFLIAGQINYAPLIVNQDLALTSEYSCKLLHYFARVLAQISAWLNVLAILERIEFFLKQNLFKFATNNNVKTAIYLGLIFFLLVFNAPNLFFNLSSVSTYVLVNNQTINYTSCTSIKSIILITSSEISTIRIFLPIVLQTCLSVVLIRFLYKNNDKYNNNASPRFTNEYRYAFTIVILNIVCLFTEIPYMINTIYFGALGVTPTYPLNPNTSRSMAIAMFIYACTFSLSSYMYCSLFFVNIFLNKKIKKEIRYIFCGTIATQYVQNKNHRT